MWDNAEVSVTGLEEPERVAAMFVTDGTLSLLNVRPSLGRIFTPEDDSPGEPLTVILSHAYWQKRFGGDATVLGKILTVNGRQHEVVGVLPRNLRFLRFHPDLFLPGAGRARSRASRRSGLMIRSFQALRGVEPGFVRPEEVLTVRLSIPTAEVEDPEQVMLREGSSSRFPASAAVFSPPSASRGSCPRSSSG
jgi:hypothetical protein